jgi:ribosomal protein L35
LQRSEHAKEETTQRRVEALQPHGEGQGTPPEANKSHILTHKDGKRLRRLRRASIVQTPGETKFLKRLLDG